MAKKVTRKKVSTAIRAKAAAKVLVEGKSTRQAAREAGTSQTTVRNAVAEVEAGEDLAQYVAAYRAKAVPKWLQIVDKAAKQAEDALEGSEARDAAFVAKTFAELAQRGAGEPDITARVQHGPDLSRLSTEDLRALDAIYAKAEEPG